MGTDAQQVLDLIAKVRTRWRRLTVLRGTVRAAVAVSGVLVSAVVVGSLLGRSSFALALLGLAALASLVGAIVWGLWPSRKSPSNARVARFIEEADPSLDDRLVSAVGILDLEAADDRPRLAGPMLADAVRRAAAVAPAAIVPGGLLRRAGVQTLLAALLVGAIAFVGRDVGRRSLDALSFTLFPSRTTLQVSPGSVRLAIGSPVTIEARLVGNSAPVTVQLLRADEPAEGEERAPDHAWSAIEMAPASSGSHRATFDSVKASFAYRVVAGGLTSDVFDVTVAWPPRVTRVDVEYAYPPELGLNPHVEEDSGEVYAPVGTRVRLQIHTAGEGVTGRLALANGTEIDLTSGGAALTAALTVSGDSSYRIPLRDASGLTSPGDTEYFIRAVEDRPPEVRVLRPARDREVTRLEEVEIEAEAADDFGVDRFELVYAVAGGPERVLPFDVERGATAVSGHRLLYLEELDTEPGDFVSYYVRARDRARGRRTTESRSDLFFLQVRPFGQDFTLAQSQAMAGGAGDRSIDDLVAAQKEIIVATWQLDRRAQVSGSRSEDDVRAVGRAEAELKTRVEQTSSLRRASNMRDPRRRPDRGGAPQPSGLGGGQPSSEEDAMTAAALAMGRAVAALDHLNTGAAMAPELEALTHLLKAQGEATERQVMQQQAGSGAGSNRAGEDLSGLFDRELRRLQQTNYETPTTVETSAREGESALDRVRELARRQDELLRRQRELERERSRLGDEELKRELERLTREQTALRQQAEELAQEMARQRSPSGQQSPSAGRVGSTGERQQRQSSAQMREVSEEMRGAATEMTRQDADQAQARGARALERLREIERQLQATTADGRRRALGDLQLEARQLADAERMVSDELGRLGGRESTGDAMRRLAGEQERLAERARRLQDALHEQADATAGGDLTDEVAGVQQAAAEAASRFRSQQVSERMQQLAQALREGSAERSPSNEPDGRGRRVDQQQDRNPGALRRDAEAAARELASLADSLAAATVGDADGRQLADRLARARQLRERMETLARELERLDQQARERAGAADRTGGQADPSAPGQPGQSSDASDAAALQEEYGRQLREARQLLEQLSRDDPTLRQAGIGVTFEGQGMVLSAPGTEAFKQDFSSWEQLRRQATQALVQSERRLSEQLRARASRDRLASGIDERTPADYQQQVDDYFKALAGRGRP